jgi:2-keto-4-pentenoate hydratase/2-oxohepta-3-ene-1,7-dioic acid hydratase in catechol pathway
MRVVRYVDQAGAVRFASQQSDGSLLRIVGEIFGSFEVTAEAASVTKVLAPVAPTNLFCIGLNYRHHAEEGGQPIPDHPIVFLKATTALQNPGDPIALPRHLRSDQVDYEGELAVVIGKTCRNVEAARALDYVLGYTAANDVSARDWQNKWGGGQWCRGKTFDTFAPMGPCLVLTDEIPDPGKLTVRTTLNGQVMQDWPTSDMIFGVPELIAFLSGDTTLMPGTVILTGTPHGVGAARKPPVFLKAGDSISVEVDGIGVLSNPVVDGV